MKEKDKQPTQQYLFPMEADSELMENENESSGQEDNSEDEGSGNRVIDYRAKYKDLKKKTKILVYENVYFQNNLSTSQRRLLKVTRDCSFLLDRLLAYERPELSSSDNDGTDSSDDSSKHVAVPKRRKIDPSSLQGSGATKQSSAPMRKTKKGPRKQQLHHTPFQESVSSPSLGSVFSSVPPVQLQHAPGHMVTSSSGLAKTSHNSTVAQENQLTKEEIERHLQSRQKMPEVVPEGELPTEMFNNSPSSPESNDLPDQTSPSNLGEDCLSVYSQT